MCSESDIFIPKPPLAEDPSPLQPCQAVETVRELGGLED